MIRRDPLARHQAEMDRMRHARLRMVVAFWLFFALILGVGVGCVLWLFTHPEQIGTFAGRVANGIRSAK